MTGSLQSNLDDILFLYGTGFVLIAIVLLGLRSTVTSPLPWKWLGLSAAALGLSAWGGMVAFAFGSRPGVDIAHTLFFVAGPWLYYRALLRDDHPGLVDRKGALRSDCNRSGRYPASSSGCRRSSVARGGIA